MAAENIRGDTPQPTSPVIENEQISDIILILDKMELLLQAVTKLDKNGKYEAAPVKEENRNSFLKLDRYANMFESFVKNLWSQLKDPTRFGIFSIKEQALDDPKVRQAIEDMAQGRQTDAVREFLEKYDITPKGKEQSINHQNEKEMAKQNQNNQNQAVENGQAQTAGTAQTATAENKYRFNEAMIDWEQLKNFGLSREYLQERGLLDSMLRGYKTNQVVPISMNFGSAVLRTDARLSFQQSAQGPVVLGIHGIRQQPDLERPFFGHIFSEEDKKNLRESGNMGRVVPLRVRNEEVPSFLSIDKLTNEIVAMKAESAFIPDEISGVKLTDQEKVELREGKAIYVEGMTSKSGNSFDAYLQFNADRKGLEYIFQNDRIFNRQELGGVALSPKQIEALNAGKAIFVEDMKRKDGEYFSAFVKLDEASGRPSYTRYNPDSPEGAREIYIPKELNGVKLTAEDREELGAGKTIFLKDMISRRGEVFSSFVRLNMETGNPQYSKTQDGFNQREEFKIPAEIWGVVLTAKQRGQLQDGKAVLVEGMTGYDGKKFSQYVKADFNSGKLNYYNGNPDRDRSATQRNVVSEANRNRQAESQNNRRSTGRGVSQ